MTDQVQLVFSELYIFQKRMETSVYCWRDIGLTKPADSCKIMQKVSSILWGTVIKIEIFLLYVISHYKP